MRTSEDIADVHEDVDTAERELRRVSLIANQTLCFHKQATSASAHFCYDLIGNSLAIYQGRIVNQSMQVEKRKRAEHPVTCLGGEIRQVLSNLIGMQSTQCQRVVAFCGAGKPRTGRTIVVPLSSRLPIPGRESAPRRKKMFDAFFTTKGIGGTGLGLWVSHEIVSRHHGYLRLKSCQSEGESGRFLLSFCRSTPYLKKLTLTLFPAVSGIVLDAGMKDMPCETLVQKLKAAGPSPPVIVVTAPGVVSCKGADHYLESFEPSRILALLQKLEPEQTAAIGKQNQMLAIAG